MPKGVVIEVLQDGAMECVGVEVEHLKRGENGEMLRRLCCRWLMTTMGGLHRVLMGFAYIKRFQPINPRQKLIRPPICECRAVIFLSSIDFDQFIACIISIDFGQFIARINISHAGMRK